MQNKIDLVDEKGAKKNYKEINNFLKKTPYKNAPIIPVSAQHSVNIDALIEAIEKTIKTPKRDSKKEPLMFVARSFDINKPGAEIRGIKGGVLGGSLKQGKLKVGDEIEIRPGFSFEEHNKKVWKPIITKIDSLVTGGNPVKGVHPGGSIGVLTLPDPSAVKSDNLAGTVIGYPGKLPEVRYKLKLEFHLLERVVGAKEELEVEPIKPNEMLMLNVHSTATVGIVKKIDKDMIDCDLRLPVCADIGERVTISRRIGNRFRLIGYGIIKE